MTVPGNHESNWPGSGSAWNTSSIDSGGECGVVNTHRFPMPAPSTLEAPWYSFNAGPVHFVGISTEHALSRDSPQLTWLAADLAAAKDARWKVLSAHRFFYVDSSTVRAVWLCRCAGDGPKSHCHVIRQTVTAPPAARCWMTAWRS